MKRKIIKQAGQAYTVTLPIDWVRAFALDKKQEIDVEQKGNQLILSAKQSAKGETVTIDVANLSKRSIYQTIHALYARGVDEIRVTSHKNVAPLLRDAVLQMISFAVFEEKNACVLKEMGTSSSEQGQLDDLYKQVWQLVLQYYRTVIDDVCGPLVATKEDIFSRDHEINKFCLHLQRLISKQTYTNQQQGQIYAQYAFLLEILSDDINRIWRFSVEQKRTVKPLRKLFEESLASLQDAFHISYNLDHDRIDHLRKRRDTVRTLALSFTQTHQIRIAHYALNIAERSCDLMHLAIMWRFKSETK